MSRLSRFLHLERERNPKAEDAPADARSARFEAVEVDKAEGTPLKTAEGHLSRFDEVSERPLDVDDKRAKDQPFVRCATCEGDNTRFAQECQHCHADLNTAMQREYNEVVWRKHQELRDQERADHEAFARGREEASAQEAKARREMHEALARRTRQSVLDDLDAFDALTSGRPLTLERIIHAAAVIAVVAIATAIGGGAGLLWGVALAFAGSAAWHFLRRPR